MPLSSQNGHTARSGGWPREKIGRWGATFAGGQACEWLEGPSRPGERRYLMSPAAAGDAEAEHAFEQLFRASYSMLVGQVFLLTTNRAEAEEAVQEAFARLWTRWCDLRGCENPEAWLRRV